MSLSQRDKKAIWHPYTQSGIFPESIGIVQGDGALLFDEKGRSYIDAISSWWVNTIGHANPYVVDAIAFQASNLEQVIFAGFTHEPAVTLAERLLGLQPHFGKVFFSDNGSTAVEVALKMSWQYWKNKGQARTTIVAIEHAYHGDTFGAMSVSGRSMFTQAFGELLFDVVHIPFPHKGQEQASIDALQNALSTGNVAAFIAEPCVLGSAGMLMYDHEVLEHFFSLCRKHDVLTIADEVMTGFGRTGYLFSTDGIQTKPDMMCLSKGLTGGFLPMGITMASEKIHEAFVSSDFEKTLFHGHSYTANPIACAAANASLDLLMDEECQNDVLRIVLQQRAFFERVKHHPMLLDARCMGTIVALDLNVEDAGYASSIRKRILDFFLSKGILLRPLGNVLYILPPYCISEEELETVHQSIIDFLHEL